MRQLLLPSRVDSICIWPSGTAKRLARQGKLDHIRLPDGSIRFDEASINTLIGWDESHGLGLRLRSVDETARLLGVSKGMLRENIAAGDLPHYWIEAGRTRRVFFLLHEIRAILAQSKLLGVTEGGPLDA